MGKWGAKMGEPKFGGFLVKENINQFHIKKGWEEGDGWGVGDCVLFIFVCMCGYVCMYVLRHKCMSV